MKKHELEDLVGKLTSDNNEWACSALKYLRLLGQIYAISTCDHTDLNFDSLMGKLDKIHELSCINLLEGATLQ